MPRSDRNLAKAGYRWHVFAYFPCNSIGVRVAVRKSLHGAERFAASFTKRNRVQTSISLRGGK